MDGLTRSFLTFRQGLTRLVRRIVHNPVDVEDIVHEAYLRSLEASRHQKISSPKAFIARTARNLALNHIASSAVKRNEPYASAQIEEQSSEAFALEDQVEADRQFSLFCEAVEKLPRQCRKVFTLKQVYGLSQREIAQRLKITEKTVEYHVSQGLLHCRRYLRSMEPKAGSAKNPGSTTRGVGGSWK
jgi:RNA polymerase sigma-70 factor (ECF subfamily)